MIKWLKYELSIMSLLLSVVISAQQMPEDELWMEPDRPGMATGTGVMPFKKVMWETGFEAGLGERECFSCSERVMQTYCMIGCCASPLGTRAYIRVLGSIDYWYQTAYF